MTRWSLRQSGTVRTTIRISYHVPKEMIDWICEHAGLSEPKALAFVRDHIGKLTDEGWHTIAYHVDDADLMIAHKDDNENYISDGYIVYDGATVV